MKLADKERTSIIKTIFSPSGLAEADDVMMFDCRLQITKEICQEVASNFLEHFEINIRAYSSSPEEVTTCKYPQQLALFLPERIWTNNNASTT